MNISLHEARNLIASGLNASAALLLTEFADRQQEKIERMRAALERITTFREGEICQNIAREALAAPIAQEAKP